MTHDARPPFWAEPLLRLLLPPHRVNDVTGDLLEAYREDRAAAHAFPDVVWWARQVVGTFLRAYWAFPVALMGLGVAGDVLNSLTEYHANPPLHGLPILTLLAGAGLAGGVRTGRTAGGVVAAVGTQVIWWTGMASWWALTTYPFASRQQQSAYWITAWQGSAAPGETFLHWIVWDNVGATILGGTLFLLLSFVLGALGGVIGRRIGRPPRQAVRA